MLSITSAELRRLFLSFFEAQGHQVVPSSSLVPVNDPTLLFTNAGMVQFKDVFLGRESRDYSRATSTQRCVRAGGKHNDLENVGYTARHHTFFEMLGNFSFGDYFKEDAIRFAWRFLTEELQIPAEKLWITVYAEDKEAESIWLNKIGVDPARFSRIDTSDNFWSMGDVGPCGPCSEIFYDHGPDIAGGPPGTPEEDGDRYIEIWNLVFMQYDRDADGVLNPLPKPSVDTGMGLERIAAVLQGVHSNYEIDIFRNLISAVAQLASVDDISSNSLRVIADHIRSCAFLVVDGVLPSNEGRGYVLRRIIRRAVRHGYRLGIQDNFFYKLVKPLCEEMGEAFPELPEAREQVERVLLKEEKRFAETLIQGMKVLEQCAAELDGKLIPGSIIFQLYDTYGFPVDLTADFAREHQLMLDMDGFEAEMEAQRSRARAASHFSVDADLKISTESATEFTGYTILEQRSKIIAVVVGSEETASLKQKDEGIIILDSSPFYAESGGQIGDRGVIQTDTGRFLVDDTLKQGGLFLHKGRLSEGTIKLGQVAEAKVDSSIRASIAANHSATHLLHAALRLILGEHVQQKGSLVRGDRLRFDFSHFEPISVEQLQEVEYLVNQQIRSNYPVQVALMSQQEAIDHGAMALFGEKYGDEVRVLSMGSFSMELCGGTHVSSTGDIGLFKIIGESGVAAGVRRIEAVTGDLALQRVEETEQLVSQISTLMKVGRDKLTDKIEQLLDTQKRLEKEVARMQGQLASASGDDLVTKAIDLDNDVKLLAVKVNGDGKSLRELSDQLKSKLKKCVIVLASVNDDSKITLVAGVSKDLNVGLKAGELVNFVAQQVGGKGGGRPDFAQAGGNEPEKLSQALETVESWVKERLR